MRHSEISEEILIEVQLIMYILGEWIVSYILALAEVDISKIKWTKWAALFINPFLRGEMPKPIGKLFLI